MSLGLVFPTLALIGASPEKPPAIPAAAPIAQSQVQAQSQAQPQTDGQAVPPTPPVPVNPPAATTDAPAITLEPLTDPATSPATPADASVVDTSHTRGDPLEGFNRHMFAAYQTTDRIFLRPVAMGYRHVVPKPVRSGLRHFFSNLGEPIVFVNDLLQLKPGRAFKTFERFVINTTLGVGGFIDVAKSPNLGLPHHDNGFGNTLAYYGVGPGPYLFLPVVGPTTLRDLIGGQTDDFVLPLAIGNPFDRLEYQLSRGLITGIDERAEADAELKMLLGNAVDPYATLRSVFLQNRAGEVQDLHSKPKKTDATASPLDDPLGDPAAAKQPSPLDDPLSDPAAPQSTAPATPAGAPAPAPVPAHP